MVRKCARFLKKNSVFVGTLLFLFFYSAGITLATPPASKYEPGETLDPSCAPGDTNCSVLILPDQTGNSGKYLTTDGSTVSWATVAGGIDGSGTANYVTYWSDADTLTGSASFTFNGTALSVDGAATFNDSGADVDFRIEGDTNTNLFFVDASTDRVGIGDNTPVALFTVGSGDLFQVNTAGLVFVPNGATGAPSYSFTGDIDTGLYTSATDTLSFTVGGTTRFEISPTGRLLSTQANSNLFLGSAGNETATGVRNTAVGLSALDAITSGLDNTIIGWQAGGAQTSANYNVAVGNQTLESNVSGAGNTAIGFQALNSTTAGENVGVGRFALLFNTSGSQNTALGSEAMFSSGTGSSNVAIGYQSLYVISGDNNVALGYQALFSTDTADNNVGVGYLAGTNATGGNNIFLGTQAGDNVTSGANNLVIGHNIDAPSATGSNQLSIGNIIFGTSVDGTGTTVSSGNIGIGTASPDRRLHSELSDSGTNTVVYAMRLTHVTSGTATTGFGVGQEFEAENASGTNRVVSSFAFPYTDATNATEDTDFVVNLIDAGSLTERLRIDSDGTLSSLTAITLSGTGTLNGLDTIDATTEATLEAALDIGGDISGTGLSNVTIGADKILESHLKSVNTATDEYCLTYESTTGDFEWQTCGVTPDSLDFTDFADAMTLDASTTFSFGASTFNLTFTNDGSGNEIHNLTSTGDIIIQDNGTTFVTFSDTGNTIIAGGNGGTTAISSTNAATNAIQIGSSNNANTGSVAFGYGGPYTNTSGNKDVVNFPVGWEPTSGTGTFAFIDINATINQTGGANGISRGVYVNPTLTAAADFRGIEIGYSSATAYGLYQSGSLTQNYFAGEVGIGTASPSTRLHVYKSTPGNYDAQITMQEGQADGYAQISFVGTGREWHFGVGGGSETAFSVPNKFFIWDQNAAAMRMVFDTTGQVGIGTTTPDRLLHPQYDSATTNAMAYPMRLTSTSSGTVAAGFGPGIEFEAETSTGGTFDIVAGLDFPFTDPSAASEDADFVVRLIDAGTLSERFRVDSDGNVGVKQTAPSVALHVGSNAITDGTGLLRLEDANSTCDFTANAGSPSCGSDKTLKKNINTLDTADLLARVTALDPVSYNWKTDSAGAALQFGFIAQEVEEQFPDLVDERLWIDGTQRKFLNMGGLMPYVVGAIKELELKVSALPSAPDQSLPGIASRFFSEVLIAVENGAARLTALITGKLTVGSPEQRTGVTLYDEETGEPYCLSIAGGVQKITSGECSVIIGSSNKGDGGSGTSNIGDDENPPEGEAPEGGDLEGGENDTGGEEVSESEEEGEDDTNTGEEGEPDTKENGDESLNGEDVENEQQEQQDSDQAGEAEEPKEDASPTEPEPVPASSTDAATILETTQ